VVALGAMAACAAPSRRLSPRVVNDPIVLPCGLASVTIEAFKTWYPVTGASPFSLVPSFRVGLTDRLELDGLGGLGYAFLDDAPDRRGVRRAPLSLALRAGTSAIGYSSEEGLLLYPFVRLDVARHVTDRWRLGLSLSWAGYWTQNPIVPTSTYGGALSLLTRRQSRLDIDATVTRQLTTHVALKLGANVFQAESCVAPFCDWALRGGGAGLSLWVRPVDWVTLGFGPGGGFRYRPSLPGPSDPTQPVESLPRSVGWYQLWGEVAFYW